jgi:hypothetical protein
MNQRDIEQLSAYLDGELKPSDSARLEARLASDPVLASALETLREPRALLRRMPHRRAPRNFTLTRKMVGLKPPLPRTYPVLRFATAAAAFLFVFSFLNLGSLGMGGAAAPAAYGVGGGAPEARSQAGGGSDMPATEAPAPVMEMSAPTEAPAIAPELAPTNANVMPTETSSDAQTGLAQEAPTAKEAPAPKSPLLTQWQLAFGLFTLLGLVGLISIPKLAARKWREK